MNHGLIPGDLRTGRQAAFFTIVNPMDNQNGSGETLCDLSQARIAPYKKLETLSEYNILVQSEARSTKRTAILSMSNAVNLYDTLPAEFIEKAICMKEDQRSALSKESVVLRPRVVLKAISQCGSQELLVQEARSSWESQQDAESYGETRSNTADF